MEARCRRWAETASVALGGGNDASTRGATWTKVVGPEAEEELVGGSNAVVAGRMVRSMGTGQLADASLRVERNDARPSWFGVQ